MIDGPRYPASMPSSGMGMRLNCWSATRDDRGSLLVVANGN